LVNEVAPGKNCGRFASSDVSTFGTVRLKTSRCAHSWIITKSAWSANAPMV